MCSYMHVHSPMIVNERSARSSLLDVDGVYVAKLSVI
jgi:hypothetical protein